jgi:hypothetical protein
MGTLRTSPVLPMVRSLDESDDPGRRSSTRTLIQRHTNDRFRLRISAPGSSPASHRIWKPLQMPSNGPPASANPATAFIAGANRATAPVRR